MAPNKDVFNRDQSLNPCIYLHPTSVAPVAQGAAFRPCPFVPPLKSPGRPAALEVFEIEVQVIPRPPLAALFGALARPTTGRDRALDAGAIQGDRRRGLGQAQVLRAPKAFAPKPG